MTQPTSPGPRRPQPRAQEERPHVLKALGVLQPLEPGRTPWEGWEGALRWNVGEHPRLGAPRETELQEVMLEALRGAAGRSGPPAMRPGAGTLTPTGSGSWAGAGSVLDAQPVSDKHRAQQEIPGELLQPHNLPRPLTPQAVAPRFGKDLPLEWLICDSADSQSQGPAGNTWERACA